jgi:cell wall-associated NlpC family hydrolase
MFTSPRRASARPFSRAAHVLGAATAALLLAMATMLAVTQSPASATTTAPVAAQTVVPGTLLTRQQLVARRGLRIVRIAASKAGTPYRYGATGPGSFDCSGFTRWVYAHVGRNLPHSSAAQAGRVHHISGRSARPGDLVFFSHGGHVYHVAIYAGHHQIWHAPFPGARVRKERIWTSAVSYGRVR